MVELGLIFSALIGASIGSIGSTIVDYLLQLQSAIESLYMRLHNIKSEKGEEFMEKKYYMISMTYAIYFW